MTPSPAISRSLALDLSLNRRRDYVKLTEVARLPLLRASTLTMIAESTQLSLLSRRINLRGSVQGVPGP